MLNHLRHHRSTVHLGHDEIREDEIDRTRALTEGCERVSPVGCLDHRIAVARE